MLRQTFQILFGSDPASFETPSSVDAAVRLLADQVKRSAFQTPFSEALVGRVGKDRVILRRYRPLWRNDFRPCFVGRFVEDGHRVRLVGAFRIGLYARTFMSIWFGFLALWMLVSLVAAIADVKDGLQVFLFPLAGIVMAILGVGIIKLCVWMASSDHAYIVARLEDTLGPTSVAHAT